jgi:hypothetical protein
MFSVPVGTDTQYRGNVQWWGTSHIETGIDPCDRGARFQVTDEDGDPLLVIETEPHPL